MSEFQSSQQAPIQIPTLQTNAEPEFNQSASNQSDNQVISINTSQDFQNIDVSRSQQTPSTFNDLKVSESHEQVQQETVKQVEKQEEQQTQQVQSEIVEQEKPQQTSEIDQAKKSQVDYESIVSVKLFETKINESLQLKNQGNELFKSNLYKQAIQKYSQGLRLLDPQQFYGATQAECQKMAEVSASLLFNIGSCYFNINLWRQAEIYFTQTITINPNHIKAIYKRAVCRYQLQNYEQAMSDIKQAFNKDKSNVQIHKSYEKILEKYNEQVKKAQEDMKQISSKIFRTDSQKSINNSQVKQEEKQQKNNEKVLQQGQQQNGLWGFAPLAIVSVGVALFLGYKKWFAK